MAETLRRLPDEDPYRDEPQAPAGNFPSESGVKGSGVIDLNTAPVAPRSGAYRARIDGRAQHVLSVTQILRGSSRGRSNRDRYETPTTW